MRCRLGWGGASTTPGQRRLDLCWDIALARPGDTGDHGYTGTCRYGVESVTCAAAAGVGWGRVLVDLVALLTKCQVFLAAKQTCNS